ncbi:Meckel syndrome type 1 protein [Histomonas meleagridis]|uniref:Meckel syndrome type 1 protein n=1 Tax=Histomonas meleagridis TaxID=135588 RepID=UPI0035596068|nr:Meckel syndrome type 1 protein [Histomonas meleagridis]KAH0805402.1 Meckel syndrome type 1 protein [Histomonas meleagridis]
MSNTFKSKEMQTTDNRFGWSIHRTLDPIGLLKVRVTLSRDRQIHNEIDNSNDKSDNEDESSSDSSKSNSSKSNTNKSNSSKNNSNKSESSHEKPNINGETITRVISWQEKIFAPNEDPDHQGEVIFTKISEDHYIDPSEIDKPFRNNIGERPPTDLANAVMEGTGPESLVEIVQATVQSMHIFCAIQQNDGSYHMELLCIIRVYSGGRIDVRPPFSNKTNPETRYHFFTPSNESIYYSVEVIEDKIEDETPFERTLLADIKRRRAIIDAAQSECSLSQPPDPPGTIRMFYKCEISTAQMFESDSVAIEYNIKLPSGWKCEDSAANLRGCSQLALCRPDNQIAHINMPIDFVGLCQSQTAPTMQLLLHSYTNSKSRIVVGYGSLQLPMTRGYHEITIDVWRVQGTILEELKLLFLDSGIEIQPSIDSESADLMNNFTDDSADTYNRFGLHTVGTGKVTLKINLVQQSTLFRARPSVQTNTFSRIGSLMRDSQMSPTNSRYQNSF